MRRFEEEFIKLNKTLLLMGSMVAQSTHRGVLAVVERSPDYAHQVIDDESKIDEWNVQVDAMAATLIALEQPVASDMRLIVSAIRISTDLERMGDLAVNVAKRALSLMQHPELPQGASITELANLVESMVLRSLDAFVRRDAPLAHEVLSLDDAVNKTRNSIQEHLINGMKREPDTIERALDHLVVARSLERIADHARNIAEGVIYLVQGIDVRHRPAAV